MDFALVVGQGYIWMVHKVPGTEKWDLAMRSRQLWENFAQDIKSQGMDPQLVLGWMKTGTPYSICLSVVFLFLDKVNFRLRRLMIIDCFTYYK